jgi:hypothetical protein
VACQLIAQSSICVSDMLVGEVKRIVDHITFTLSAYSETSPMRPVLCSTIAVVVDKCGIPPEECGKALAHVLKLVMEEDVAAGQGRKRTTTTTTTNEGVSYTFNFTHPEGCDEADAEA